MNKYPLIAAIAVASMLPLASCKKNNMLGKKEMHNFRTGLNRDNGKNGRTNILQNSVFVQPLAETQGEHEEEQPTVDKVTSTPVVEPTSELGKGDGTVPTTTPVPQNPTSTPVPQNPTTTPVPQNPGKTTEPTKGGTVPTQNPGFPNQSPISMFPTRKVCSDQRVKYHGFALRNLKPEELQFVFFPIETSSSMKPFFVEGNAAMVADIVNTGHVGMNLSAIPDGTYNLLLCRRGTNCAETSFLAAHKNLPGFQKDLHREYADEYSREVSERTTKFTRHFEKNARYHHNYRDRIMDDRRGIFGGAARIVIQGGQVKFPSQYYLVKDNGIARVNAPMAQPAGSYEAYTAPQIVMLYDGNKRPVRNTNTSSNLGKGGSGGKDPCYPDGNTGCGGYPPYPRGGDDCDDTVSPLIVDLDNTGLNLSAPLDGVLFDIEGDGLADKISWPRGTGANFIALDLDGNGTIDSGKELFGNYSVGPDNDTADNGFLALAKYDDDKDGKITEKDAVFKKLVLWNDANFNGKSESNELKTLAQLGIKSIDLNYENGLEEDRYGNQSRERSVVEQTDGTLRMVFDIWFRKI